MRFVARWLVVGAVGCAGEPAPAPVATQDVEFEKDAAHGLDPPALDILLVIDNEASMCQEQADLSGSVPEVLAALDGIDYRIAITTMDLLTPSHAGKFQNRVAGQFPFGCSETRTRYCLRGRDEMCTAGYDDPEWGSQPPLGEGWACGAPENPEHIVNCNGTFASDCRKLCATDRECDARFLGDEAAAACRADPDSCAFRCMIPSGVANQSGCVRRPPTAGCPPPDELPLVLTPQNAAGALPCTVVVGAEQHNNASWHPAFDVVRRALSTGGPRAEQASTFLRLNADLLIVFVSDEDEFSTVGGEPPKEEYHDGICWEAIGRGEQLMSVGTAAQHLMALKPDPARVHVAAIVGDSTAPDPAVREGERAAYLQSRCGSCPDGSRNERPFETWVCEGPAGKAGLGQRYIQLVERFSGNGQLFNLCQGAGAGLVSAVRHVVARLVLDGGGDGG